MNRADRLDAIQRIGRALSGRAWPDIDLVLRTFEFPTADYGDYREWNENEYEYVLAMLGGSNTQDSNVAELDQYLRRDAAANPTDADGEQIWRAGSLRIFISHTSKNKRRAADIANIFERIGAHGFVAHDTIEPTREWQDVIESALLTCDAMCAMITTDFVESRWCDQEVGFVIAQRKLVLPLKLGSDPYGFVGKYQGIPSSIDRDTSFDDVDAMLLALARHPTTSSKAAPVAVRRYARSGTFDSARAAFALLLAIPTGEWTPTMIDEVDRANVDNTQLKFANLPSGLSVPEAVDELLKDLRQTPPPVAPADDDIPF